ncbi:hypothetical protein NMG60_11027581 [Bertholletia excelsa]
MSDLPEEVSADILSRLPVKSLLRFRCVSRNWCSLIDRPDFVKLHLNRSIKAKANLCVILRDSHLYSVDFDSLHGAVHAAQMDHHPLWCQDYGTEVWGSCNGLLCISNALDTLCIWNPSTRKSRKLPYASIEIPNLSRYCENRIYGFGYDCASDDYKVVRIVVLKGLENDSFDYEVKVYSLKSNSWHRVEKFPTYPNIKRTAGVLASSALHWVVSSEPELDRVGLIVAFDLKHEKFQLVPPPDFSDMNFFMNVQNLNGFLAVVCNYCLARVDIWVMKLYGLKESWTKLISVTQPGVIGSFQYVSPIAYSKSGEEILLEKDAKKLLWYDLKERKVKSVRIHGIEELLQVEMCMGSLVPINSPIEGVEKKLIEEEEKNVGNFLSKGFKLVL